MLQLDKCGDVLIMRILFPILKRLATLFKVRNIGKGSLLLKENRDPSEEKMSIPRLRMFKVETYADDR